MKVLGKHLNFHKVKFNPLTLLFNCLRCFEAVCFLASKFGKLFTGLSPFNAFTCNFENTLHITTNLVNCQVMIPPKYSHVHVATEEF